MIILGNGFIRMLTVYTRTKPPRLIMRSLDRKRTSYKIY